MPQDCVLFNDTVLYNIAYGGIKNKAIKDLVDNKKDDELQEKILGASKKAQFH